MKFSLALEQVEEWYCLFSKVKTYCIYSAVFSHAKMKNEEDF